MDDYTAFHLYDELANLLTSVENGVIEHVIKAARKHRHSPEYTLVNLRDVAILRARLEEYLGNQWQPILDEAQRLLDVAYQDGRDTASLDLDMPLGEQPERDAFLTILGADMIRHITGMPQLILREALDQYHDAIAPAVTELALGTVTKKQAMEHALGDFAKRGISGFTDKSGRRWTMDAYTEMAVRTGVARASRYGYSTQLLDSGYQLVQVTGHGYSCDACTRWEGKILSLLETSTPTVTVAHAITGEPVTVHVDGTLTTATSDGLFHPNCGHTIVAYLPGVTHEVTPTWDPETYQASQTQRDLERKIRKEKRALLPTQWRSNQKIRDLQAQIRDLLDEYPKLARQNQREQPRKARPVPTMVGRQPRKPELPTSPVGLTQ